MFSFKEFLEKCPTYKEVNSDKLSLDDFLKCFSDIKIELICDKCNKEKTFYYYGLEILVIANKQAANTMQKNFIVVDKAQSLLHKNFMTMNFRCSHCKQTYFFALLLNKCSEEEFTIMKVGQYPSFGQLSTKEIDKYRNELGNYYNEFKCSLNCYSQGKGIAAFVYLRRILEHLIETKYKNIKEQNSQEKFIDKLKTIEKKETVVPEELKEVKGQIYAILSKGLHEYSEDECMELYDCVKLIVELILDKELEKIEKVKKIKDATSKIKGKLQ